MQRVLIPIAGEGENMSSSNNSPITALTTTRNWRLGHDHATQASTNRNDWNRPSFVHRAPPNQQVTEATGDMQQDHPWRRFEERVRSGPYGLTRFPLQPHSPIRILILDDGLAQAASPRLQQFVRNSPPRIRNQWHMNSTPSVEEPGLTQDEFKKAMSKLRKHIFSPTYPRRKAWKWGLFNRSNNNNTTHVEEDDDEGRECTICLDAFVRNQQVLLTPCNHMFHSECLVPWVKSHGQCPLCRFALVERRVNALSTNNANFTTVDGIMDIIALIRAMEEAFEWINNDD